MAGDGAENSRRRTGSASAFSLMAISAAACSVSGSFSRGAVTQHSSVAAGRIRHASILTLIESMSKRTVGERAGQQQQDDAVGVGALVR